MITFSIIDLFILMTAAFAIALICGLVTMVAKKKNMPKLAHHAETCMDANGILGCMCFFWMVYCIFVP